MLIIILTVAVVYAFIMKSLKKNSFFGAFGLMVAAGIATTFATIFAYAFVYTV